MFKEATILLLSQLSSVYVTFNSISWLHYEAQLSHTD